MVLEIWNQVRIFFESPLTLYAYMVNTSQIYFAYQQIENFNISSYFDPVFELNGVLLLQGQVFQSHGYFCMLAKFLK